MSDKDGFIRNPNRSDTRETIHYEPEWKRLGVVPVKKEDRVAPFVKSSKKIEEKKDYSTINGILYDENNNKIIPEQGHMIDNNDYVFPPSPSEINNIDNKINNTEKTSDSTSDRLPKIGEYILMVSGKVIHTGSLEVAEKIVSSILYGENEQYTDQNIDIDDIVVLKRVKINVGIFIDRQ